MCDVDEMMHEMERLRTEHERDNNEYELEAYVDYVRYLWDIYFPNSR